MIPFIKAVVFTDIHFGLKTNSIQHNDDCLNFIKWMIKEAKEQNCETCLFLGDYFHNRNNINLITMKYGLEAAQLLSDNFEKVIMLVGNHDSYYKDSIDVNSVSWAKHLPNIQVISEITKMGDVVFAPWLVKEEHKRINTLYGDYLLCHAEIPNFIMTGSITMPDVGEISENNFNGFGQVYSGHFHIRQTRRNITYMGNAFPHNFGDAGDDNRGCMILDYGKKPVFIRWPDAPKYRVLNLSSVVNDPALYLPKNGYVKLVLDTPISYEEGSFLKETLVQEYELRELALVPMKVDLHAEDLSRNGNVSFQSVNEIIQNQIVGIQSEFFKPQLLLDIFRGL